MKPGTISDISPPSWSGGTSQDCSPASTFDETSYAEGRSPRPVARQRRCRRKRLQQFGLRLQVTGHHVRNRVARGVQVLFEEPWSNSAECGRRLPWGQPGQFPSRRWGRRRSLEQPCIRQSTGSMREPPAEIRLDWGSKHGFRRLYQLPEAPWSHAVRGSGSRRFHLDDIQPESEGRDCRMREPATQGGCRWRILE